MQVSLWDPQLQTGLAAIVFEGRMYSHNGYVCEVKQLSSPSDRGQEQKQRRQILGSTLGDSTMTFQATLQGTAANTCLNSGFSSFKPYSTSVHMEKYMYIMYTNYKYAFTILHNLHFSTYMSCRRLSWTKSMIESSRGYV